MPERWYSVHPLVAVMAAGLILGSLWGAPVGEAALIRPAAAAGQAALTAQPEQGSPDEEERWVEGPHQIGPHATARTQAASGASADLQSRNKRQSYQAASRGLPTGRTLTASWYGADFQGRETANGEIFHKDSLTAAHKTLPFGTVLRVTNLQNGRAVEVRINDRGPFIPGRDLDLSEAAFREIAPLGAGVITVQVEALRQEDGN